MNGDAEATPEVTLKIVDSLGEAIALFNRHSPRFSASLISEDAAAQERFYDLGRSPTPASSATAWTRAGSMGKYALGRPGAWALELGAPGRLLARGIGVLSGDSVYTVSTAG